jgi:putative tricarboxylic transport membrane protein
MSFIRILVGVLAIAVATGAFAGPLPEKLRIMGPAEREAGFSRTARAVQQAMTASGAAARVEVYYVPGQGGLVGLTQFVKDAKGDATQLMVTGYTTMNSVLANGSAVTLDEVTPIARLTADVPFAVLVAGDSLIKNAQELAAMLRADPSSVSWLAGSVGGAGHTAVVMFALLSEADPTRLNFSTFLGGTAVDALLAGKGTVALSSSYDKYEPELKTGRLRALGTTASKRRPGIAAPTLTEQGIPLVFENWRGIVAAPGITAGERQALSGAVERMARSPAWKAILDENKWEDAYLGGAAFEEFLKSEREKAARAYRVAQAMK